MASSNSTPHTLYHQPRSLFVANFIGTSNVIRDRVAGTDQTQGHTEHGFAFLLRDTSRFERGAPVSLTVRPEKTVVHPAGTTLPVGVNHLDGVIESVVFLGESTTFLVRVGTELMRAKRFIDDAGGLDIGARVVLAWKPADTNAFSETHS